MTQMITYPIHGDIVLDIDQILTKADFGEFGQEIINLKFKFRENVRHQIALDISSAQKLLKALEYVIDSVNKKQYKSMVVIIK